MRIALNLLPLAPNRSGGIEWYARNLARSLAENDGVERLYLFTNLDNHDSFGPDSDCLQRIQCAVAAWPQLRRAVFEQVYLPGLASKLSIDVLHSPFYTWPLRCTRPGVVTICDMLYKVYPRWVGEPRLTFWRVFVPLAARRCKRIVTISESSKRDIVRFLRVPSEKVVVTPLAADSEFGIERQQLDSEVDEVRRRYDIERPYMLSVGGVGRHKNTVALIKAFHNYSRQAEALKFTLVITGRDYGAREDIERSIARLDVADHVKLLGYIPRRDLPALYRGAELYVCVSFFEGFGLTALEAMASGVPVIVSNRAALPEVVGDAGVLVEPDDVDGLTAAIQRVTSDQGLQSSLRRNGLRRAQGFSWRQTAQRTLETYRAAAGL